jgi:dUTP pyrophosphatase
MTNILVLDSLKNVLDSKNIDIKEYTPAYNGESAGLDLYNCGKTISVLPGSYNDTTFVSNYENYKFKTLIPTGIKIDVPIGYVALIQERGSVTKTPLKARAGVIDAGYTGEVFVNCVNIGNQDFVIEKGSKLPFQIVVIKCDNQFNVVTAEEYVSLTEGAKRKDGSVGSSD